MRNPRVAIVENAVLTNGWQYARCFVTSFGWFEAVGSLFISMEYFPLGDLQKAMLDRTTPFPEEETREVTFQILEGLCYMHGEGFAHRDLKPNVSLPESRDVQ